MTTNSKEAQCITVKQLFLSEKQYVGTEVCVKGWIRTCRKQKSFAFVHLTDGTDQTPLQVVIEGSHPMYASIVEELQTGASISIIGTVKESPAKGQNVEIGAQSIELLGSCPTDYPLQKKNHSFEFLRTIPSLRPRTNTQGAVARLRSRLALAVHQFFQQRDYTYLQAPIITTSDCEGAGELFMLSQKNKALDEHFFGKEAFLTVSGQLNAESYALAFSKTYTFGPTFRAENSHTSRHVAEFWMIEPEIAFCDLQQNMDVAQEFIQHLITDTLTHSTKELDFFNQRISPGKIDSLHALKEAVFEKISYTDVIAILEKAPVKFEYPVSWGIDLQSEHERYIAEQVVKGPVIIYDYPKTLKPFYMRENADGKTVSAMDVIVPHVGEIIGGSQREERYEVLKEKMEMNQLDLETYGWYLDLRKYGTAQHSGFGMGFERMVQYLTGLENIRDVSAFPRVPGHAID